MRGRISRRAFVRVSALAGAGMLGGLSLACQQAPAPAPTAAPAKPTEATKPAAKTEAKPTEAPKPAAPAAQAAATTAPPAKPVAKEPSGTLTIAQGVDAESMDPYVTTSSASKGMIWTIFDRLVYRDLDLAIQPGLALSWRVLDDTTWELKLRQGVQFHNGEPFDATTPSSSALPATSTRRSRTVTPRCSSRSARSRWSIPPRCGSRRPSRSPS